MSQSEDKKDTQFVKAKEEQDENRIPVGELKWSKEQEEAKEQKEKQQEENEQKSNAEDSVQSEVSATLLDLDKELEVDISSKEEKDSKKQDPLAGIEDTLTPIDFKTYEFDADQLKAIEQELNSLNPQKLDEELNTLHQQQESVKDERYEKYEGEEQTHSSDSKWVKRSIWILSIPALLVIVLFISLLIGHTLVGGQPVSDIFDLSMWMHVYNLIYG